MYIPESRTGLGQIFWLSMRAISSFTNNFGFCLPFWVIGPVAYKKECCVHTQTTKKFQTKFWPWADPTPSLFQPLPGRNYMRMYSKSNEGKYVIIFPGYESYYVCNTIWKVGLLYIMVNYGWISWKVERIHRRKWQGISCRYFLGT